MTKITLPALPISKDEFDVMSYDDIRARDLEVAHVVLEVAAKQARMWAGIRTEEAIRALEVSHE